MGLTVLDPLAAEELLGGTAAKGESAKAFPVLAEIKASGFPVILHPTMARAYEDMENAAPADQVGEPGDRQGSHRAADPATQSWHLQRLLP